MKSVSKFIALCAATCLIPVSGAFAKGKTKRYKVDTSYSSENYYKPEGELFFKIKATAIYASSTPKDFPSPSNANPKDAGNLFKNGYGLEGSTTIFLTNNIAAELGIGGTVFYTSNSALDAAKHNYASTDTKFKRKHAYGVPLVAMAQYHIAPYGAVRPHVGVGYHGTYFFAQSNQYSVKNAHGLAIGAGVDFVLTDDTMITLDVKRLSLEPKVSFKEKFLGREVKGKVKIDPILISLGFGFKF